MRRSIEITFTTDLTDDEQEKIDKVISLIDDLSDSGVAAVFRDQDVPVPLPQIFIEGPARLYDVMVVGQSYTEQDLQDLTGYSKSTCNRMLRILCEQDIILRFIKSNDRGRPSYKYQLKRKKD